MNSQSTSKRNTVAKQRRMKVITNNAFKENVVNKPEPESEEENAELSKIEELLKKYDDKSNQSSILRKNTQNQRTPEMDYQIVLNVERIRVLEILFQPSIIDGIN